jgi:glyoxylase-like metal-dependent hydrolase (beta-lactamase superfamily II)
MDTVSVKVECFHDPATFTFTYVVSDPVSGIAAVIDPVLDYDPIATRIATHSARRVLDYVMINSLQVQWILETHAHADHLSAAQWLKRELAFVPRVAIGAGIRQVQATFKDRLLLEPEFAIDGSQFDLLLAEGDRLPLGSFEVQVLATPGHTPDSLSYLVGDAAFVGDTLFAPYYGTARCDFPGGDARALFTSIHRILELPDDTRIFLCHDYPPNGQAPQHLSSPREQRSGNLHLKDGVDVESFVAMRHARDATLAPPRLLEPSLRVNVRAGHLSDPLVSRDGWV